MLCQKDIENHGLGTTESRAGRSEIRAQEECQDINALQQHLKLHPIRKAIKTIDWHERQPRHDCPGEEFAFGCEVIKAYRVSLAKI